MDNLEIKLNHDGIRQMLRSKEARDICKEQAQKALNRLGEGYEVTTYTGSGRVNASIRAESAKARQDNSKNNTILKALRGG